MKANNAPAVGRTPFQKWCDKYQGLFYLIPWIIGFVVFKAIPFGQSLFYSFTDMNFFNGISEYGLMNYIDAFTTSRITKALITTFQYSFITVPLKLIFALFIAYILNFNIKFVNLFRTAYYIPSILGGSVAIAVLWRAHLPAAYLAVRLGHGAVPGCPEGRARRPVRGRHHRRRRQVASVLLHHRPHDHPHHLLQPGHPGSRSSTAPTSSPTAARAMPPP